MSLTYAETRDREHLRLLRPAIQSFIAQCPRASAKRRTHRLTLFFFPGGMATQLIRATRRFIDGSATPQEFEYEPVWSASLDPLVGGARDLKMYRDGAGTFRDKGSRIVVSDAAISLGGATPHDGLIHWCENNDVGLFVFPWDWRRRLDETVAFFVGTFLPAFRTRVLEAGCPDPLERFSLVGHSFGGMIVNLILRGNNPIVAGMTHAITVATPFYGYAGQVHRWCEGEPYLNALGLFKQDMMETIASLPGLYTLHFLDEVTYRNSTNLAALTSDDEEFPLPAYPSLDTTDPELRADPYNPQTVGGRVRYPATTGFDRSELEYARLQFQQLAAPMEPCLLEKFYNIRGVCTEDDQQTPVSNTVGRVTWDWIPPDFDAGDSSPIHDCGSVPGDDTQPAWSARLAINDPSRCITVRGSDISHICMMNHPLVVDAIGAILRPEGAVMSPRRRPQPEPASDEDIVEFMRWLSENPGLVRQRPRLDDPDLLQALPRKFGTQLDRIAHRILMDIMKRPAPRGLVEPEVPPRKAAGRTSAARARRGSPKKKKKR